MDVQKQRITQLQFELENQELLIAKLSKMLFGATSEKRSKTEDTPPEQLDLFALPQAEQVTVKEVVTYERKKPQPQPKKTPRRQPLPVDLPRVEMVIEPEIDTTDLVKIGEEVTEVLDIIPPQFRVLRVIRPKYATPPTAEAPAVVVAGLPERVIPKGIPSTRLLAYVAIHKFLYHLPYYRQIQLFADIGVAIRASTINGWLARMCALLRPLYLALCRRVMEQTYLMADETTIKVLKATDKQKRKKGRKAPKNKATINYFWVYYAPLVDLVVFRYHVGRGREYPREHLRDFTGHLQTDGLSVYDAFDHLPAITLVGCMAHIRRKFVDAQANDPARTDYVLDRIGELYGLEATARQDNLSAEQRYQMRQQQAKPVMEQLKTYLDEQAGQVRPKSAIGQAIRYARNRWQYQLRYLDDGALEIDNNRVENAIRPVVIGRKNYLFAGSPQGAEWAAILYSLLGSAIRHGLDPLTYLTDILHRLPDTKLSELAALLPDQWQPSAEVPARI